MLVGVVLTGGASRRMGRNKALIELDGVPMARRVADALTGAGCGSVIAYGGDPVALEPLALPVQPDAHPGTGPLGGVLGALELFADADSYAEWVLVVACDLPALTALDLAAMVAAARSHPGADVVVARAGRIEPTCAVWSPAAIGALRELFDAGERAVHRAIEHLASIEVDVDRAAVRNINTPDDLDRYA